MTEQNEASWNYNGKQYPLFPFDVPPIVTLPNGTKHKFRMWDEATEKKREDLLKTVVITSPAIVHGENPRDVKTDFSRSILAYYGMMIDQISGVMYNGNSPDDWIEAQKEIEIDGRKVKAYEALSVAIRKAAAARLYGGRVDVEKPKDEEEGADFDPFAVFEDDNESITEQVEAAEQHKEHYRLALDRSIAITQQLGIEQLPNGQTTPPTHFIRYVFDEPNGDDLSKWELKGYRGYSLALNKGGDRSERFYNLETVKVLFNKLIDKIEGASVNGAPIDLPSDKSDPRRAALLDLVPLSIKKVTVATLFAEVANLGNV